MSDYYYDFNSVREQVIQARQRGLCTFKLHPLFDSQMTVINESTWAAVCREPLCSKGYCEILLDITVADYRTRQVTIYYYRGDPIAYVILYGTILGELEDFKIIDPNRLQKTVPKQ